MTGHYSEPHTVDLYIDHSHINTVLYYVSTTLLKLLLTGMVSNPLQFLQSNTWRRISCQTLWWLDNDCQHYNQVLVDQDDKQRKQISKQQGQG